MKYFVKNDSPDLMKAGAHKYVKRTGSPGNYKYWYKMPDGSLKAGDDDQSKGRLEHIKRMLLSHRDHAGTAGHHTMNHDQIKAHTGAQGKEFATAKKYVDRIKRYNRAGGQQWNGRHFDHDFGPEHLAEAHKTDVEAGEAAPARTATPSIDSSHWTQDRANRGSFTAKTARGSIAGPHGDNPPEYLSRNVTSGTHEIRKYGDQFKLRTFDSTGELGAQSSFGTLAEAVAASNTKEETARRNRAENDALNERATSAREASAGDEPITPETPAPAAPARARRPRTPRAAAPAAAPAREGSQPDVATALNQVAQEAGASNSQSLDKQEGESNEQYQARLMNLVAELGGPDFRAAPTPEAAPEVTPMPQRERARLAEATARVNREIGPRSEGATALAQTSPEFAVADQPIARMEAVEARGGNPYLSRAKEIYHNIQHDLKPERKEIAKHMLQAIESFGSNPMSESALLAKYKEVSGSSRVRTLPKDEFEKATFMSLDEVIQNKPLDIEVERMKRGYAAKQFARMKPFVKDSWLAANASAPPPYPTFGDIKSWSEHGSKPDWAGTTRMAVPQELHEAAHKGADGKPKYPPAWMPIHMMPVWNYVMKKSGDDSPYQTRNVNIPNGRLQLGNQAAYQEGFVIAALRKYVQMRGGAEQMVDIPSSKLQDAGITHSDIFKGMKFKDHDLSDNTLKKMMAHKIVDPVALIPFLDQEMKSGGAMVKKSFTLVVDEKLDAVDFRKSFVIEDQSLKKSLIEKIKKLRSEKGLNG